MLKKLTIRNFKSFRDITVDLPRFAVFFGPNSAGKSNLLDAIQSLAWIGNARTLFDAIGNPFPVRGYSFEAFRFPSEGLPALFRKKTAQFTLEAELIAEQARYRYRVTPEIDFTSGQLGIADEYLALLGARGNPKGAPAIERVKRKLHIRQKRKPAHPREEPIGLNHAKLSDRSLGGDRYYWLERVRAELLNWRTYYLEPRTAMRTLQAPADMLDIGMHGEYIAPFLYKLQAEHPRHFEAISRTLRSIVPSVEMLRVDLNEQQGLLDLSIRQGGVDYSSRILSEGTLRILALCAIAVNPWRPSLIALEEPENGVHPRRLELIAQLLFDLAIEHQNQIVVTTHSPLFCDAILKLGILDSRDFGLFNVRREGQETVIDPFEPLGSLFKDTEIAEALTSHREDGLFQSLLLRGFIDE